MTQWLSALAALPGVLSLISSNHQGSLQPSITVTPWDLMPPYSVQTNHLSKYNKIFKKLQAKQGQQDGSVGQGFCHKAEHSLTSPSGLCEENCTMSKE